jgi:hypothetical protein
MKTTTFHFIFLSLAALGASAQSVNFDDAIPGGLPDNWTGTKTGEGEPMWTVEKDDTFKDAGKVGLWTKADSVTLFDDFSFGTK